MDTKLTLKLNNEIIEQAKKYAKSQKLSLSKMIENYLAAVISKNQPKEFKISPLVESLTGVIQLDEKKKYSDFLSEKYK